MQAFKLRFIRVIISIFLILSAPGCRKSTSVPGELRVQLGAEPVSLDPVRAEDGVSLRVLANLMEGLVRYDGEGKLQPGIALRWKVSSDRIRFELDPKRKWSDGTPVRAHDFVLGLRRALDPKQGARLGMLLLPIRGAKGVLSGKKSPETLGVEALDDSTLVVHLSRPAPYLVSCLAMSLAFPARDDILKQNQGRWPKFAPVTGPYRLVSHQPDVEMKLVRNPHYPRVRSDQNGVNSVVFKIIHDEATSVALFENEQMDIVTKVPSFDLKRMEAKGVLKRSPFVATYYLAFNTKKAPFDQVQWRRAVAGVINRNEIALALQSGEAPALSWIPPTIEGYWAYRDPRPRFAPSVEKIKPLVAKLQEKVIAGFDSSGRNQMIMEKVQADLKTKLTLPVSLQNSDWKTHIRQLKTDAPHIYRFGRMAPFMDPLFHLMGFTSNNANNMSGWKNQRYDQLVDQIQGLESGRQRRRLIDEAQRILLEEEAVAIPLYHYTQTYAVSSRVKQFRVSPMSVIYFNELRL